MNNIFLLSDPFDYRNCFRTFEIIQCGLRYQLRKGIECIVVPRKTCEDTPISASNVRLALQNGDYDTLSKLVPQTTLDYFRHDPVIDSGNQASRLFPYVTASDTEHR